MKLSNGTRVTAADWRTNRLVDKLAKDAASFHAHIKPAAATINSAAKLSQYSLAQLAQVTHASNHHKVVRFNEERLATTHVIRDSMERPRFASTANAKKDEGEGRRRNFLVKVGVPIV